MSAAPKFNVSTFASISGISETDKMSLITQHGDSNVNTYSNWFDIISKDYSVPNDLRKHFRYVEESIIEAPIKTKTKK